MGTLLHVLVLALLACARLAVAGYEAGPRRPKGTEKRADDIERFSIKDAPQWTISGLGREFHSSEDDGQWSVMYNFVLISTNSAGQINSQQDGAWSCTFTAQLQAGMDHTKESVWLQQCEKGDLNKAPMGIYFSWGYVEAEDSAVVTILFVNPDKDGKSRIAWTSFHNVSADLNLDEWQDFENPPPMVTEEYVCRSDAWPCNQQS